MSRQFLFAYRARAAGRARVPDGWLEVWLRRPCLYRAGGGKRAWIHARVVWLLPTNNKIAGRSEPIARKSLETISAWRMPAHLPAQPQEVPMKETLIVLGAVAMLAYLIAQPFLIALKPLFAALAR